MKVFVAVATHSSFAGAARALQLTPPVVTRTVGALENHLGVQLLIRTTRQVRLTEAGAQYLRDSERILAALDDAEAAASDAHGEARGLVTVTAPALFGRLLVMPIILDFLEGHSRVDANTIFVDRVVDLVDEGVDIAIRIGHLPDSSLMASKVGTVRRMVCASPSYLEREGAPASPDELRNHRLLVCPASGNGPATQWRFGTEDAVRVAIHPRVHTTSNDSAVAAAVNGWGVTRVLLDVTGTAEHQGAERLWTFAPSTIVRRRGALPLRWTLAATIDVEGTQSASSVAEVYRP